MGQVYVGRGEAPAHPAPPDAATAELRRVAQRLEQLLDEQKRTNKLLEHLLSATNRRTLWDD